ncbi:MAG: hypothetical protein M0Z50_15940 [Planctomycetia bacterium]|nr:hypothetical protein [Planctomycetia bacterium]
MESLGVSRSIGSEIRRLEDNFLEFDRQQRRRQQVRNIKNTLSLLLSLMVFYLLMLPIFAGFFPHRKKSLFITVRWRYSFQYLS